MEDRGWVPAASETGLGLKFVTRCSYGAHSQSPFLFRFSGMFFAWSNRVAVFELFPTCQVRVVRFYQSVLPPPPPRLAVLFLLVFLLASKPSLCKA
jgi:hypothetical protein